MYGHTSSSCHEKLRSRGGPSGCALFLLYESYKRSRLEEHGFRLLYTQILVVVLMPLAIWTGKAMEFWLESYVKILALFYLIVVALKTAGR